MDQLALATRPYLTLSTSSSFHVHIGTPPSTESPSVWAIQTLREANHEVFRLKELPAESSDAAVIAKAYVVLADCR